MKAFIPLAVYSTGALAAGFNLIQNWQGGSFFDSGWDWYGSWDNLTLGDVNFVNKSVAMAQPQLAYINNAGNAVVRVDNVSYVPQPYKRNTVRISTTQTYGLGSLWVMDAVHLPFGCSVWPAFWSQATKWPEGGEIDTLEQINMATTNQMALHTVDGCMASSAASFTGTLTNPDCGTDEPYKTQGCTITENNHASYGAAFAAGGGGVFATLLADTGVFIWFFPRNAVPGDLLVANPNTSPNPDAWPAPSAAYPASTCPTAQFLEPQHIIIDITLCGAWGGVPATLNATCPGVPADAPSNYCYTTYVAGAGGNYWDAYFEIQYVRVWSNVTAPTSSSSVLPSTTSAAARTNTASTAAPSGNTSAAGNGVNPLRGLAVPTITRDVAMAVLLWLIVAVGLLV